MPYKGVSSYGSGFGLRMTGLGWKRQIIIPGITVKPVLFACPLFHEFRDLGNLAKITGR